MTRARRFVLRNLVAVLVALESGVCGCDAPRGGEEGLSGITEAFALRPGVIVDPARPAIYLMSPESGIDAVDPTSGELLWRATDGARPLVLHGNLLLAQAEPPPQGRLLRIVALKTEAAGVTALTVDIELSQGLRGAIDEELGESFDVTGGIHAGTLIISWISSRRQVGGAAPRGGAAPPVIRVTGAARIDLDSGDVDRVDPAELPPLLRRRPPDSIERLLHDVTRDGEEPVAQRVSADGRHVLLSHWAGPTATAWEQYVWSIYSLETGDRVAELSKHSSSAPFFLWGARLVHESRPYGRLIDGNWIEEPLTIRAIDVATGAELWKRPIRDTRYRGPYPPSNHPPG